MPTDVPGGTHGRSDPGRPVAARRTHPGFLALAVLVVAGAALVRLALLGRQSYWIDELFSVNQSAGSLSNLLDVGSTEVHTPLYAGLLWLWTGIGDPHEGWTRLLSTLCALASVVVTHRGLRPARLCEQVRWALITATAASSTSLVYSLETRSYAVLLLGSVGLTATTLTAALHILDGGDVSRRTALVWTGWSILAASVHPFGAVLTLGAATVLVLVTVRWAERGRLSRAAGWAALAVLGCSLQAAWILLGRGRAGFAAGTGWIRAPGRDDLWDLLTTTFGSGGLTPRQGGFAWTSWLGVAAAATLVVVAAGFGSRNRLRHPAGGPAGSAATAQARAAAILLALAVIVVGSAFGVAQVRPLWTLRNLVVVTPALQWGVICLAAAAAGTAAGRRTVATVAVALLGAGLVPAATGLAAPYKTDFRGLVDYLVTAEGQQPDVTVVVLSSGSSDGWWAASDRPSDDPARRALRARLTVRPVNSDDVVRVSGPQIVAVYHGVADPRPDNLVSAVLERLDDSACRAVPVYGFGMVRCG